MAEQTATPPVTPTTPTEGAAKEAASATSLLSGSEGEAKPNQQQTEPAKPAGETKPEGEAKPAEGAKPAAETKPAGAHEKYEFKAPEGRAYDADLLGAFSEAAKAANLPQDAAQKLLDTMAPTLAARIDAQTKAIQEGWAEASRADKEFGGDKLQENLAYAKKAMDQFSPNAADGTKSAFRQLLDNSGLGNNPEFLRFAVRVGKAISEDGFVASTGNGTKTVDTAKVLYDKTPAKA